MHEILDLRCQFTLDVFDAVVWDRSSGDRSHALSFHSCAARFHCSRKKISISNEGSKKIFDGYDFLLLHLTSSTIVFSDPVESAIPGSRFSLL